MLALMESFLSIQGEGSRAGHISVFVRFGGCNFSCPGFAVEYKDPKTGETKFGCDSFYSVDRGFKKNWDFLAYADIVKKIDKHINDAGLDSVRPDIVITGGEPTMYWSQSDFQNLLIHYISRGHKITIETNGSLDIDFAKEYQKEINFSMSVKLAVSGEPEHRRINVDNLANILENTKGSYFKFVIDGSKAKEVGEEITNILKEIPWYSDVYVMPLGDIPETLEKNALPTAELAISKGWKYSDRLHIRLWGNKVGV